ncbi:MAG: alcohol dehydrogenase [Deltaproteobacteria bacterium HGW-Deltaproteobacteria-19]|jgi:alcohol dehydrogenase|nr:MAG: alcohol dehydrogenase [Deltaproteobacteria bacterium HGW-Deltaproteobacteria-19]
MKALFFDGTLRFCTDVPEPLRPEGWARIRVLKAGICGTDLQILAGYHGYRGILGHEFVGVVEESDDSSMAGRRVVGEINIGCGRCNFCRSGMARHCLERRVPGIAGHPGCMAEFCTLPSSNLHPVPDAIGDERAVFIEPLAAACEILEQVPLTGSERTVVLGDGRLGILCAWVLSTVLEEVTLVGHHPAKLEAAHWRSVKTCDALGDVDRNVDLVVEATGTGRGLEEAITLCRPRGIIILKTTIAQPFKIDLAPVVVREITVVGSRCGRFSDGLQILLAHPDLPLERLITGRYPLEKGIEAFVQARRRENLKVLLEVL